MTTGESRLAGEVLSPEECEALLDAVSFDADSGEPAGEETTGEETTAARKTGSEETGSTDDFEENSKETDPDQTSGEEVGPRDSVINPDTAPAGAAPAEDFIDSIGVNTHINYTDTAYGDYDLVESKLEDLGVRHIRDKAHLGDNDFNSRIYGRYQDLNDSAGIKTNLIVDPREQGLSTIDAEKINRIEELSGDSLATLEGPNELDIAGAGDWPEEMRGYQEDLFEAVNDSSAAEIPVLSASLAHARKAGELGDMSDAADVGNMHPYPGGGPPTEDLEEYNIDNTRRVSGEKPLVATETGYHTAEDGDGGQAGVSEEAQAKYLPRLFLEYFDRGIARSYAYELLDQRPDPSDSDQEENFGLVRADGTEKPAYTALANLISLLDPAEESTEDAGHPEALEKLHYSVSGDTEEVRQTAFYKRDGTFYLVLWQEVESYDTRAKRDIEVPAKDVTVRFEGAVGDTATYLPSESSEPTETSAGGEAQQLQLAVPDHPLVVEVEPGVGSREIDSTRPAEDDSTNETVEVTTGDAPKEVNFPENTSTTGTTAEEDSIEEPSAGHDITVEQPSALPALGEDSADDATVEPPDTVLQGVVTPGAPSDPSAIDAFNDQVGAGVDVVTWFEQFGDYDISGSKLEHVMSRGATPQITLEPKKASLEDIAGGGYDDWLDDFAATIDQASPDGPVLVRFAHEMNGDWYPWAGKPKEYRAAFRHVSQRLNQQAPQVQMVFCPNVDFPIEPYYPGEESVDWLGLDGYNKDGGQSPAEVFRKSYEELTALDQDKPVLIGETAATEYPGKAGWIKDLYENAIPNLMPRIKLVVWFDIDKEKDWRIDSSEESLEAYKDVAGSAAGAGDTGSADTAGDDLSNNEDDRAITTGQDDTSGEEIAGQTNPEDENSLEPATKVEEPNVGPVSPDPATGKNPESGEGS